MYPSDLWADSQAIRMHDLSRSRLVLARVKHSPGWAGGSAFTSLCITVCPNPLFNIIYIIRSCGFFYG